jgi:UDP-glucose 4-epimerase
MIGQTLNIGSNCEFSAKDLAHKIADMVRIPDTHISFGPARPGEVLRLYADPRKFIELCGWKPQISLDEGLAKTIEFFRYHPLGLRGLMEGESGRNWEEDYL